MDLAIIGISGKFSKANNIEEFWNNIQEGKDFFSEFPNTRKRDTENYLDFIEFPKENRDYVRGAYLDEIDKFDYEFFKISPKEASLMDPIQRILLQETWKAIEDSGYKAINLKGFRVGTYIGLPTDAMHKGYGHAVAETEPENLSIAFSGNLPSIVASRVSYHFDFKGPAVCFDTACSSSLVAVHYACQGIKSGDCEVAIAGGINIRLLPIGTGVVSGIESSDGLTRTFDINGDGTGTGEGVGVIVLKSLDAALADGDNVYAIIKGSAINQDGKTFGITAPDSLSQADVITRAWDNASVEPESITYIEAHGTATKLGDPVEVLGIKKAFKKYTQKNQFCAISSVKTNMGHLIGAAGITGLIKAVMSLKYKQLAPNIHFNRPNSKINFTNSPVYVNDELLDWDVNNLPRRCGVSSFGISGTNCHIVLEEAPENVRILPEDISFPQVLSLSARNEESLTKLVERYIKLLKKGDLINLLDVCYTANTEREHYNYRLAIQFINKEDLIHKLDDFYTNGCRCTQVEGLYYSEYRIQNSSNMVSQAGITTESQKRKMSLEVNVKITAFVKSFFTNKVLLDEICEIYIAGAEVNWNEMFKNLNGHRVSLPTYVFSRKRCWFSIPEVIDEKKSSSFKQTYYEVTWQKKELENSENRISKRVILVLKENEAFGNDITKDLRQKKNDVIEVEIGQEFKKVSVNKYIIGSNQIDYDQMIHVLSDKKISQIIHLLSVTDTREVKCIDHLEESQMIGSDSLLHLMKAIEKSSINENIDFVIVSKYVNSITKVEKVLKPEYATIFGLGKTINWEYPNIRCRCIDIDDATTGNDIVLELNNKSKDYMIAFRERQRYVEIIDKVNTDKLEIKEFTIKEQGVYIIAGGAGGLGIEVAKFLASKNSINLIFINRSCFPERNNWLQIMEEDRNENLSRKIQNLIEIEKSGSNITFYSADISDSLKVEQLFGEIRSRYGSINGVVHSATSGNDFRIRDYTVETFQHNLRAKVSGVFVLDNVTKNDNLDFFIIFSSAMTLVSGLASSGYTAANSYIDAYSAYRDSKRKGTLVINWPQWLDTGIAQGKNTNESKEIFKIMPPKKAINAFDEILGKEISRVIIGELNFQGEIYDLIDYLPFKLSEEILLELKQRRIVKTSENSIEKIIHVKLNGKEEGGYSCKEIKIAQIWGMVLGYEEISIYDNFFEIGGDSILAVKMEVELEKDNIKIKASEITKYPTIEKMAEYLESSNSAIENSKILNNIKPFNDVFYRSCFYNSFFPVINYFNKSVELFLMNDVPIYTYSRSLDKINLELKYHEVQPMHSLLKMHGIEIHTKLKSADVIKDIIDALSRERPVIIWVDCFYESIRKDTYLKEHLPHTWLVYGFNTEEKYFHIIEHTHQQNLSYSEHKISYEDLLNSYQGHISNFMKDSEFESYFEFYLDENFHDERYDSIDYKSIFLHNMNGKKNDLLNGLENLVLFIKDFRQIVMSKEELIKSKDNLLHIFNNIMNAKKADKYRIQNMFDKNSDTIALVDTILECWDFARLNLAKYIFSNAYNEETFAVAISKLELAYSYERKLYDAIFLLQ